VTGSGGVEGPAGGVTAPDVPDPGEFSGARRAVALIFLANGLLFGSWAARIPALQDRLDLSEGTLGIALAFLALGALVAMPAAGAWASRAGSRRPTRLAFVGVVLAPALAASAPTYATLLAAAFVFGVVNGALDVVMNTQGTTVERRCGRLLLGRLHAAFSGGGLLGAASGAGAAAVGLDARLHLAIAGAVMFAVVFPLTGALLRGDGDRSRREPTFSRPEPALVALGVLAFCCLLAEGAAADWSAVFVDDDLGASAGVAGLAYAAFSALMFLGRLMADRVTERVGPVRLLRGAGLLAGAGLAVGLAVGTPAAAIAGFAALGAGLSVVIPLTFRAAGQRGDERAAGPALAAVSTMGYTGFLAGPPLIGLVAELTTLGTALGLVAALAVMATVLARATATPARAEPRPEAAPAPA